MSIQEALKKFGLRITHPRLKILEVLSDAMEHHLSAEAIHKQLHDQGEDVGLATVYRVLTQFEAAGLVIRHNFEGESYVFEMNNGEHHDHMVCLSCGCVTEFCDPTIEQHQSQIAAQANFLMSSHVMILYGTCQTCQT